MGNFRAPLSQSIVTLENAVGLYSDTTLPLLKPRAAAKPHAVRFERGVLAQGHPSLYHQDCHRGDIQDST